MTIKFTFSPAGSAASVGLPLSLELQHVQEEKITPDIRTMLRLLSVYIHQNSTSQFSTVVLRFEI